MKDYKYDMGVRIREERKKLKLTQEEVAERIDVSVKHFSEVERCISGLSIENLIKLSNILGVSLDYVVKGEIDKNKWNYTLAMLEQIPEEKENLIRDIINTSIELSK